MRTRRAKSARVRAEAWTSVELYDEAYERMDPPTRRRFLEARIVELDRVIAGDAWPVSAIPRGNAHRIDRAEQARYACMYALHELLQHADAR